jgi:hypothetical protein
MIFTIDVDKCKKCVKQRGGGGGKGHYQCKQHCKQEHQTAEKEEGGV